MFAISRVFFFYIWWQHVRYAFWRTKVPKHCVKHNRYLHKEIRATATTKTTHTTTTANPPTSTTEIKVATTYTASKAPSTPTASGPSCDVVTITAPSPIGAWAPWSPIDAATNNNID
jgi:hypothetical protein